MTLTAQHLFGIIATLSLFVIVGTFSGRKVRTSGDFSVSGNRSGSVLVAGTILGTLVGGASTIGTAQLAYVCGFSAWWFTLGGGLACLLLGAVFVTPLRRQKYETIPRLIQEEYGEKAALAATLFVSLGMTMNIIPQIMSSAALVSSLFPLSAQPAALSAVLLMVVYVFFGGLWGTGMLGIMKISLTSLSLLVGGGLALRLFGGPAGMVRAFPPFPWFSLFGRGIGTDLAAGFSLLIGVLSSQIYFQAVFAAKDLNSARKGTFASTLVGPMIGLGGVFVGLFMRANHPGINAAQALPLFVIRYLPPWFAGVVLATLLFAAVGSGAGLVLGACTVLNRDVYQKFRPKADDNVVLRMFRILILSSLGLALAVVYLSGNNGLILEWTYLSLGFRGASVFFPMMGALFLAGRIDRKAGTLAVIVSPLTVILWTVLRPVPVDPLYPGLAVSFLFTAAGYLRKLKTAPHRVAA